MKFYHFNKTYQTPNVKAVPMTSKRHSNKEEIAGNLHKTGHVENDKATNMEKILQWKTIITTRNL